MHKKERKAIAVIEGKETERIYIFKYLRVKKRGIVFRNEEKASNHKIQTDKEESDLKWSRSTH